jgi:lipopolysaccharide export system protein LptA
MNNILGLINRQARKASLLLVIASTLLSVNVYAQQQNNTLADDEQPINIKADQLKSSEKKGQSTYTGSVVVTQGSLTIMGDKIDVFHPDGNMDKSITFGNPATFKRFNVEEQAWVHGQAKTIEYNSKAGTVLLIGSAQVEQPGKHVITGPKLYYNMTEQTLEAQSTPEEKKRISVTFTPSNKDESEQGQP